MYTKKTALVVDDNSMTLMLVSSILTEHNFHVVQGRNGVEAISQYASNKPSLIIIDMNMPIMNGCRAAYLIRTMYQGEQCKIILFTAESKAFLSEIQECKVVNHIVAKDNVNELREIIGNH